MAAKFLKTAEYFLKILYYTAYLLGVTTIGYRKVVLRGRAELMRSWGLPPTILTSSASSYAASHQEIVVVYERPWYARFCWVLRLLCACAFYYDTVQSYTNDMFLNLIRLIVASFTIFCTLLLMYVQLRLGSQLTVVINSFLCLHQRIKHLVSPPHDQDGSQYFIQLSLTMLTLTYDFVCIILEIIRIENFADAIIIVMHMYLSTGVVLSQHALIVGYITIGSFYERMNRFLRVDFYPRAQKLGSDLARHYGGRGKYYKMQLLKLTTELDECNNIYAQIFCVGQAFHRSLHIYLFTIIGFEFFSLAILSYTALYEFMHLHYLQWGVIIFSFKILFDSILLILSAYAAVHNAQLAKYTSLDHLHMNGDATWEQSMELFLTRLHFEEFKLNLLGLFDVSNEVVLIFTSGTITFLTYIWQKSLQKLV